MGAQPMSDAAQQHETTVARPAGGALGRLTAAVRNGLEIARFGGLGEQERSPYAVAADAEHHRLRHYFPDAAGTGRVPVLFVPPLMMTAEVWDVEPASSAVATMHDRGHDPWVVDFGSPEHEEGGLERTLTDHVLAVSEAVDQVRNATGRDVHLMGYSQGGMFCYEATAYRRGKGVASLVAFGSPVDLHASLPPWLPQELLSDAIQRLGRLQEALMPTGIPSWATRVGFQMLDPVKTLRQRLDFVRGLYDRDALQRREGMRRFLGGEAWLAFPGPALADVMDELVAHNRLLQGGFVIGGRTVTLADIACPILVFVGTADTMAPPPSVRAIAAAAPRAKAFQVKIPAGHFGLVVGSRSAEITWPAVAQWLEWCERGGPLPDGAAPLEPRPPERSSPALLDQVAAGATSAWSLGRDLLDEGVRRVAERAGIVGRLASTVVPQIPRLTRLVDVRSDTRISLGLATAERAREAPDDTFFLFEGRAHSYQAADVRIDNIVRGLVRCGVRHGQHVGVLMSTRPSAVASTVALSRLGAVTVLLRPDASLSLQLRLAPVDHLLADPEHAESARETFGRDVLVLGGGGEPRTLAPGLVDMEAIDPDRVDLPEWYTPNPGRAAELAMILVTGDGERLGISRVTNRRWATSAYGTASACGLTSGDTVYCCSPTHHATGMLVCVGGALVSGARLAMATRFAPTLDPSIFWEDVRRYAVNVVFYSGALCRALVNAPENPAEYHHPIRLFAGSGMPKGLWRRVVRRFEPARVVEFFASSEGNAVLVNLTGRKVGSLGRALPGGAELAVAAWDLEAARLVETPSGFARRCRRGQVGLLVARVDRARGEVEGRPLRGVFEPGDAWLSTKDLVRRDEDGDYWLIDQVEDVIHGVRGPVTTIPVEDVLTEHLDFIDLVAVYGARVPGLEAEIPVAALTLRPDAELDPQRLREVAETHLDEAQRPWVVRVCKDLPMTAGQRTRKRALREQDLFADAETLWLAPDEPCYVPLDRADQDRLLAELRG
jgi:putative long chain acyl-CoA synthase